MDDIKELIGVAKTKDFVADGEVNTPHDLHSPHDEDDMLATIRTRGLDVLSEGESHLPFPLETRFAKETEEEVELDLTPGAPDVDSDPVRVYLREMGASPLLTR